MSRCKGSSAYAALQAIGAKGCYVRIVLKTSKSRKTSVASKPQRRLESPQKSLFFQMPPLLHHPFAADHDIADRIEIPGGPARREWGAKPV